MTPFLRGAVLLGLAVVAILVPLLGSGYIVYVANVLLVYAVLCLGLNIVIGETGQFALAHTAFFGIGIYASGLIGNALHWPFPVPALIGGLLAGALGVLIGALALRMRDIYLALATFAFGEAMQWVFLSWDDVTGGPNGLHVQPALVGGVPILDDRHAYPIVLGATILMVLLTLAIKRSRLGRAFRAVRESEVAALAVGIKVRQVKVVAFALSGLYAGIAGGLLNSFSTFVHPDSLGFQTTITVLTMIVVGGLGSIPGAIAGAFVFGIVAELLRSTPAYQQIIYGLILMGFMMFLPRGLASLGRPARA
jgi:branched-chain amino acid transport system permease protein